MKNSIIAQNKYMCHKCYDLILCVCNVGHDMIFPPTKQNIVIPNLEPLPIKHKINKMVRICFYIEVVHG